MNLPLYQHPSTIAIVDDNSSFLASLRFQFGAGLPARTFDGAAGAIAWLREQGGPAGPERFLSPTIDTFAAQPLNVALHVERICRISTCPRRFAIPSVLVADYAMPGMNGIQLCEAVRDLPCKKILLTGTADERIAIDAFNRGLIDRYIRKSDRDALDYLESDIAYLQRQFFLEQADTLRRLLPLHGYGFIDDPAVDLLVSRLKTDLNAVEHYLFPDPSGLLLVDRYGKSWLLVIETEQGMQAHIEVARDGAAPSTLLEALEERVVIPNFIEGDGMYSARFDKDWFRHTAPARVCVGRQRYFWAVFEIGAERRGEKMSTFADFLGRDAS